MALVARRVPHHSLRCDSVGCAAASTEHTSRDELLDVVEAAGWDVIVVPGAVERASARCPRCVARAGITPSVTVGLRPRGAHGRRELAL